MADNQHDRGTKAPAGGNAADRLDPNRIPSTDRDVEREEIRSSNDRNQQLEREGITTKQNRGYDQAAHGEGAPTDPDSAEADIDRDDTATE
jgi:hypothetical protein